MDLINAIIRNDIDRVRMLLEDINEDINFQDRKGNTALIIASGIGTVDIVKPLMRHPHIDMNIRNNKGKTALLVSRNRNVPISKILREDLRTDVSGFWPHWGLDAL